ncbi:MAG: dynamin family protein [Planctomycetaceae bacterium]|nr:dynamin family protein [Planctomycetaceae bacterium]
MNYKIVHQRMELVAESLRDILDASRCISSIQSNATLDSLIDRIKTDRFRVLVIGEFSRGKSALSNAILGRHLIKFKNAPSTPIVIRINYAESLQARLAFRDGREDQVASIDAFRSEYQRSVDQARIRAIPEVRRHVSSSFLQIERRIKDKVDVDVGLVENSLQTTLAKKNDLEFDVGAERARLCNATCQVEKLQRAVEQHLKSAEDTA